MTAKITKTKAEVKTAKKKHTIQFKVSTEEKSILVEAKDKNEAEQTGFVLLLQHGEYSNENPPVITEVEEV